MAQLEAVICGEEKKIECTLKESYMTTKNDQNWLRQEGGRGETKKNIVKSLRIGKK